MTLPTQPGLARRTAYSEGVRLRNLRSHNLRLRNNSLSRNVFYNTNFSYENLVELPIVKIGLSVADLKNNSAVAICVKPAFCSICQDHTKPYCEIKRKLKCGHDFHIECVDEWFKDNYTCPLCKISLKSEFF